MWSDRRSESELLISVSVKEKLRKSFAVLSLGAISLMTLHFSAQILIHLLLLHHFCRFKFQIQIHVHAASHKSKTIDWIIASCQNFFSQKMTYLHLLHNIIIIISDNNNNNFPSGQWSWLSWQRGRFRHQWSPQFESSHRQLLLNQYFLLTVCRKQRKRPGIAYFLNKLSFKCYLNAWSNRI